MIIGLSFVERNNAEKNIGLSIKVSTQILIFEF
jgi:hypothetical protein